MRKIQPWKRPSETLTVLKILAAVRRTCSGSKRRKAVMWQWRQPRRDGQYLFRHALLKLYGGQCAVTGIRVVPVLRASHISEWAKDTENRLNPANGICLSATFDAAFDRHLISFDYDYRMLLTPALKEYFTNDETRETFEKYEGKRLLLPTDERFCLDRTCCRATGRSAGCKTAYVSEYAESAQNIASTFHSVRQKPAFMHEQSFFQNIHCQALIS